MKYSILFLTAISLLTACNSSSIKLKQYNSHIPIPIEINKIISIGDQACSVFYNANSIWVIEQHCENSDTQGIYIFDSSGITKFSWFDSLFNNWTWNEGCNSKDDCYYVVNINSDGKIIGFTYKFYINLSEGYYKVIIKDSKLIVTEKNIIDHPS